MDGPLLPEICGFSFRQISLTFASSLHCAAFFRWNNEVRITGSQWIIIADPGSHLVPSKGPQNCQYKGHFGTKLTKKGTQVWTHLTKLSKEMKAYGGVWMEITYSKG